MARVTVELPSQLRAVSNDRLSVAVEGDTLAAVLERLFVACPGIRHHLQDETGAFRTHVLCFHNQTNTRWLESLDVPVADGDTVRIMQAVSGG